MRNNNLMSNLTQMHSISNESIDDIETSGHNSSELDVDGGDPLDTEMPEETSADDTNDMVLEEQSEDDVSNMEEEVAAESISMLVDNCIRQSFALEDLAEQLDETLQGDGEGINPLQAQLITTGTDIMDEGGSQIAVENFHMNQRIATESLRDTVMEKAKSLMEAVSVTISNTIRAAKNGARYAVERIQASNIRLLNYGKRVEMLADFEGQQITDEKILNRLRKHMPFNGNGNQEIIRFIKNEGFDVIKTVTSLISMVKRTRANFTTNPEKTMDLVHKFYKEVEKLKNNKSSTLNITITIPESYEADYLVNLPIIKSIATIDVIPGEGNQSYTVVTKQELKSLIDIITQLRSEVSALNNALDREENIINTFREIRATTINGTEEIDSKKMFKIQMRLSYVMYRMLGRLVADISAYTSVVSRHAVLMVAASFEVAGVKPGPADTSDK